MWILSSLGIDRPLSPVARPVATTLLLLLIGSPASHATSYADVRLCWDQEPRVIAAPIVIGCELPGCCPDCATPEFLSLQTDIDPAVAPFLQVDIAVTSSHGADFSVPNPSGSGKATSVPVTTDTRSVVGRPGFSVVKPAPPDAGNVRGQVRVVQRLAGTVVSDTVLSILIGPCTPLPPSADNDRVLPLQNQGEDSVVAMISGRRPAGCIGARRDFAVGTADIDVGDLRFREACFPEVALFSHGDGMTLQSPVNSWTSAQDVVEMTMRPMLVVPVNLVLLRVGATQQALDQIAAADLVFRLNRSGIRFGWNVLDLTDGDIVDGIPEQEWIVFMTQHPWCGAPGVDTIRRTPYFRRDGLTVLYVDDAPYVAGNCRLEPLISYVRADAAATDLAHEFGHALSLAGDAMENGHTDGLTGFDATNIMWTSTPGTVPSGFSFGQMFRFNADGTSAVNVTGIRRDITRRCPAITESPECPSLADFDVPPAN